MAQLRRSSRQRAKPQRSIEQEEEQSADEGGFASDLQQSSEDDGDGGDSSASADEWQPPSKKKEKNRAGGRLGRQKVDESSSEEERDGGDGTLEDDLDESKAPTRPPAKTAGTGRKRKRGIVSKPKKAVGSIRASTDNGLNGAIGTSSTSKLRRGEVNLRESESRLTSPLQDGDHGAQQEADRLWAEVRARKTAPQTSKDGPTSQPAQNRAASGLDQWLGIEPPEWPSTCPEAMISDRDSLFVGFVYALNAPSQAEITQCLSHLTKVVQPQVVPTERLPPGMRHLASNRRGATHDMYAWRSLALKQGRNGLGGPEDFGLEEGQEDDGERYGAKEIAKVIRTYGATDVLVIVSRWYGGTMLGPVRFRHIEECAKAALARHMVNEAMMDLRSELKELDARIADLRAARTYEDGGTMTSRTVTDTPSSAAKVSNYENLDPDRAQRLIMARKKQLDMLQRPKKRISQPPSSAMDHDSGPTSTPADPTPTQERTDGSDMVAAEEQAAMQVLQEMECETADAGQGAIRHPGETSTQVKQEATGEEVAVKMPSQAESLPIVKQEATDEVDIDKAKTQAEANKASLPPRVKDEQDETDLTGWDEL